MNSAMRGIAGLLLFALLGFCVFGFLAAGELVGADQIPWRIGYALLGLACLVGIVRLLFRTRS